MDAQAALRVREQIIERGGSISAPVSALYAEFDLPDGLEGAGALNDLLAEADIFPSPPIFELDSDSEVVLTISRPAQRPADGVPFTVSWIRFLILAGVALTGLALAALLLPGAH